MKLTYAFVLAALMTSTAWAGSGGSGHGHPQAHAGYAFCVGYNPRIAYFSRVFHFALAAGKAVGGVAGGGERFAHYLTQRGYFNVGAVSGVCQPATTEAAAVAAKKAAEDQFRAQYRNLKIIETDWSGP